MTQLTDFYFMCTSNDPALLSKKNATVDPLFQSGATAKSTSRVPFNPAFKITGVGAAFSMPQLSDREEIQSDGSRIVAGRTQIRRYFSYKLMIVFVIFGHVDHEALHVP